MHGRPAMAMALTREQAAAELSCSVRTLDRLRERGELDWIELGTGGGIRILRDSLEAYVERQRNRRHNGNAEHEPLPDGVDVSNLPAVRAGRRQETSGRG